MIFPQLIKSIQANDKVLEIGPGGNPFYRSNVLLEKKYENKEEWEAQCGGQKPDNKGKTIFYYNGVDFPFKSNEFDYIICSHVLDIALGNTQNELLAKQFFLLLFQKPK